MGALSAYRIPPGRYAFHTTSSENVDSIRERGVHRSKSENTDSSIIHSVLDELGYVDPFPFARDSVTYCHVDLNYVESVYADLGDSGLLSDEAVVVVDVERIASPMYLGDMSIISDLIDYRCAGPDVMMHADSPDEAVRLYRESITRVECADDIAAEPESERAHTELVIDGDIPPSAVVDIYIQSPSTAANG